MTKLKMFSSERWDDDVQRLEAAVNEWMERERPVILDVVQSPLGAHVLISFLFEHERESDKQDERHASAVAEVPEIFERTLEGSELDPADPRDVPLPEAELPY
jgi:hypothetical protein